MDYRKANFWILLVLVILLNFITEAIHEGGHWAVLQATGRGPVWGFTSLVQMWGETPLHPNEWVQVIAPDGDLGWEHLTSAPASNAEEIIMLAAGPLAGLLSVVAGLAAVRLGKNRITKQMGLLLSLCGSFVASQYYLRAPFRGASGDEYFMAGYLGIPKYFIEFPLGLAFVVCFILGLRALGNWKTAGIWMGAVLLGSFPTGLFLMQANQIVQTQVDQGNPLFQPMLGFALPVILINSLVLAVLLLIWWQQARRPAPQLT